MAVDIEKALAYVSATDRYLQAVAEARASGRPFDAHFSMGAHATTHSRVRYMKAQTVPKSKRPFCGAQTRKGSPCRARVAVRPDGTLCKRCRLHGGASTGPRTAEGRERIRESNRRRAQVREQENAQNAHP